MKITDLAHALWEKIVLPGDTVIDATLGNGHDALFLLRLLKGQGHLLGYDIQKQALDNTLARLSPDEIKIITLHHKSHTTFDTSAAKLIVYNLGYLPHGDKLITTLPSTTLESLTSACAILLPGGALSVMAYRGHDEQEYEAVSHFFATLPKTHFATFQICATSQDKAPVLFFSTKRP